MGFYCNAKRKQRKEKLYSIGHSDTPIQDLANIPMK